jgi:hypothetical protein
MSAEAAAIVRSFRVGKRTCTITMPKPHQGIATSAACEWSPTVPTRLTKKELRQYRAGRDAAADELLKMMGGGNGLMVEV